MCRKEETKVAKKRMTKGEETREEEKKYDF